MLHILVVVQCAGRLIIISLKNKNNTWKSLNSSLLRIANMVLFWFPRTPKYYFHFLRFLLNAINLSRSSNLKNLGSKYISRSSITNFRWSSYYEKGGLTAGSLYFVFSHLRILKRYRNFNQTLLHSSHFLIWYYYFFTLKINNNSVKSATEYK